MKSKKIIALVVSSTLFLSCFNTLTFAKIKNLELNKIVLSENKQQINPLENNIIQVNDLIGSPSQASERFTSLDGGIFKIGFDEQNKKLKVLDIKSTYFSTLTMKRPYFILKVLDTNWRVKKEIMFIGDDLTGWGKENEINNFQYNYGDILSLWGNTNRTIAIYGEILGLPQDYPYMMPNTSDFYNFQITKDGLRAVHNPYTGNETLSSNVIDVRSEFLQDSKYMRKLSHSSDAFSITFDEITKQIKVINRRDDYYLKRYLMHFPYFKISILDKNRREKLNLIIYNNETGKSKTLDSLHNFKYEYGDIIKIWCLSPKRQSILGRVLNASADYSKGMLHIKNIKELEDLAFEITPKGLKEIRNEPPQILGIDNVTILKGSNFNKMENVSAIDDFDGDVTSNLTVIGDVNTNRLGTYTLTYKAYDSSKKETEMLREVKVIDKSQIKNYKIKVEGLSNKEKFNITFDNFSKQFQVNDKKNEVIHSGFNNLKYFGIKIFDKSLNEKLNISLNGDDLGITKKLNILQNFKYDYDDFIYIYHKEPSNLKIHGKIINEKENYTDGIQNEDNLTNTYFQLTENGLKAIYNGSPIIKGIKDTILKVGENFNSLEGITIEDDFDKNLVPTVTGTIDINTPNTYNLIYTVKDSCGKTSIRRRKVIVREVLPLEDNTIIVEGYDYRKFLDIGFNVNTKRITLSRFTPNSYFHGGFREFFKIKIKDRGNKEKLSITINGMDFSSTSKLDILNNFNFQYGDIIELWHTSPKSINGNIKIKGAVINSKENYANGLSLNDLNNTKFEITPSGLKAIYNENPVISGIDNITLKVGEFFDPLEGVSVSDYYDNNLVPTITGDVNTNIAGNYSLTYTARDSVGRETSSIRKIIVRTNEKPVLSGNDNKTIKIGDAFNPLEGIIATDFEDKDLNSKISVIGSVNNNTVGDYKLTYSVTDSDGNATTAERIITVRTNTKPKFTGVEDATILVGEAFNSKLSVVASDKEDGDISNKVKITGTVDNNTIGTYELVYSVKDLDNNETLTKRKVTVRSNEKPVIVGADHITIKAYDTFNENLGITATDLEDNDLTNKILVTGSVDNNTVGDYKLTYSVTDSDGNTTTLERKVNVIVKPELEKNKIKVLGLGNYEKFKIEFEELEKKLKIKDVRNSPIHVYFHNRRYFTFHLLDKNYREKVKITLNGNDLGTSSKLNQLENFKYEYGDIIKLEHAEPGRLKITGDIIDKRENYLDGVGNRDNIDNVYFQITANGLKSIYNEVPIISGINNITLKVGDAFNPLDGITVTDDYDKKLVPTIIGTVDTNVAGNYSLTYTAIDSMGREVTSTRNVIVRSNEKPVINGVSNVTIKVNDEFKPLEGIVASDKEDLDLTNAIKLKGAVDKTKVGTYDLIYSVRDSDNNETIVTRRVIVRSNEKPVISGNDNKTIKIGDIFNPLEGIIATDFEDKDLNSKILVTGSVNNNIVGDYKLTYSVTDSDGNTTTLERGITVRTNTKPKFTGVEDTTILVGEVFDSKLSVVALDKEDGDISNKVKITGTVDNNTIGTYELVYSVKDLDNNETLTKRKVTVRSNEKPVIVGAD
ncbi:immunoglobulin-like domain-containing protein, partial [Clostridium tarantellae]